MQEFFLNNHISIIFGIILFVWIDQLWYIYFSRKNKMTDEQLINRYLFLTKQRRSK